MLEHASPALRNEPEIVTATVRQTGIALQFASKQRRAERAIVLQAVRPWRGFGLSRSQAERLGLGVCLG